MMNYKVNDIFYSLQGEGHNTGRAAVFIRFAGCNMRCPFCDTEFHSFREMTEEEILQAIDPYPTPFVVLTGGEPTLQVSSHFVNRLHQHGYEVAMESNGTRPAPTNLDWLTVSPKITRAWREAVGEKEEARAETGEEGSAWRVPDEIKIVFDEHTDPESILSTLNAQFPTLNAQLYLQPCDTGHPERNKAIADACIRYIKEHPEWRLSLQTHKLIGFK